MRASSLLASDQTGASVPLHKTRTGDSETQQAPALHVAAPAADDKCVGGILRVVFIALAAVFFALAAVGVVVPGLPTTPFLLLTAYFLARSWPAMHRKLLANRLAGPILRQWQEQRAVERRVKLQAVALVGVAMVFLVCWSGLSTVPLACLLALASIGLLVICCLPTAKRR